MKWKYLASALALTLFLGCNINNKNNEPAKKPGLEQKVEQEENKNTNQRAKYFQSFKTSSSEMPSEEPYFSKEVNERYGQEYAYSLENNPAVLRTKYEKPNLNILFQIEKNENGTDYEFSYHSDHEWLKIEDFKGKEGSIFFYLSNDGSVEILDLRDKKINRVSFWQGKNIYYGTIDTEYHDWTSIDSSVQAKFEEMAKKYMEEIFKPAKEKLHCKEILYVYKHIK